MKDKALGSSPLNTIKSTNKPLPINAAIDRFRRPAKAKQDTDTKKPDKPHIMFEFYSHRHSGYSNKAVVSVNQLAGVVFLPQVAGVFFGEDSHDRAEQLCFHIASVSGLEIVRKTNYI